MTHWKALTDNNYFGAYALDDGQDVILTIKSIGKELVTGQEGREQECVVMRFVEDVKPMILNKTNMKAIAKATGSSYIEKWVGHRIQIGTERVSAFGETTDALRVRPYALPAAIMCAACGSEIVGANSMSPAEVAAYCKKKYGRELCAECARKEASGEKAD